MATLEVALDVDVEEIPMAGGARIALDLPSLTHLLRVSTSAGPWKVIGSRVLGAQWVRRMDPPNVPTPTPSEHTEWRTSAPPCQPTQVTVQVNFDGMLHSSCVGGGTTPIYALDDDAKAKLRETLHGNLDRMLDAAFGGGDELVAKALQKVGMGT